MRLPFKQIPMSSCLWPVVFHSPGHFRTATRLNPWPIFFHYHEYHHINQALPLRRCMLMTFVITRNYSQVRNVKTRSQMSMPYQTGVAFSGLQLNVSKTKSMSISRKRKSQNLHLVLHNSTIEQVPFMKYLGIHLSSDLTWSKHISEICNKARRIIGFLYRNFYLADSTCLNHL